MVFKNFCYGLGDWFETCSVASKRETTNNVLKADWFIYDIKIIVLIDAFFKSSVFLNQIFSITILR